MNRDAITPESDFEWSLLEYAYSRELSMGEVYLWCALSNVARNDRAVKLPVWQRPPVLFDAEGALSDSQMCWVLLMNPLSVGTLRFLLECAGITFLDAKDYLAGFDYYSHALKIFPGDSRLWGYLYESAVLHVKNQLRILHIMVKEEEIDTFLQALRCYIEMDYSKCVTLFTQLKDCDAGHWYLKEASKMIKNDGLDGNKVGRIGEYAAYQDLVLEMNKKDTKIKAEWKNQARETGLPFDIGVYHPDGDVEYIEVKTTKDKKSKSFRLSIEQPKEAQRRGSFYTVAHVFLNTPVAASATVYYYKDVWGLIKKPRKTVKQSDGNLTFKVEVIEKPQVKHYVSIPQSVWSFG